MANKPHRTFDEQINLLRMRGLTINDEAKAKKWLQRVSYYRLKGYWWAMQDDTVNHHFAPGWTFDDIIDRYQFDKELKVIIFRAIESLEIALRTKLIYYMSQRHGGLWYMDANLADNSQLHRKLLIRLQSEFVKSKEIFVLDYLQRHPNQLQFPQRGYLSNQDPDAWIIFETATLGELSKIYKNIDHQSPAKSLIANEFGLNLHSELSSWLESVTYLRNIVAHHSRLWCRNMTIRPAITSNVRNPWLNYPLQQKEEMRVFHIMSVLLYLCDAIDEGYPLREDIYHLIEKYQHLPLYQVGFCSQWNEHPIWKLQKRCCLLSIFKRHL